MLTLDAIGRTVSSARPSMRTLVDSTEPRMVSYSSSLNCLETSAGFQPLASFCSDRPAITSFFSTEMASLRSSLSRTEKASFRRSPMAVLSAATMLAWGAGGAGVGLVGGVVELVGAYGWFAAVVFDLLGQARDHLLLE